MVLNMVTKTAIGAAAGAGLALSIPAVVSAMGFTAGGILAGSLAAKMMSAAAIANGGGVPAGSIVALLQSIGAAGLSAGAQAALASLGPLGVAASSLF
ncbi:interferon alpha-inducible protein 27-like protein 2 isoform X2 [Calypte anna]|uniref:interferon alpha-inducible protein 27-like protein 2 isoform X2 n=1 Tax=Calypte anna TaxID=9244 RepID=UPI0011C34B09|nr:interferon alpha-inducible protein 27-like protein 2 isoform X2 [Calypte anna]